MAGRDEGIFPPSRRARVPIELVFAAPGFSGLAQQTGGASVRRED